MTSTFKKLVGLPLLISLAFSARAKMEPVKLDAGENIRISGPSMRIIRDDTREMTAQDVLASDAFEVPDGTVPKLGISNGDVWIVFQLENNTDKGKFLIEYSLPILHEIDYYDSTDFGKETPTSMLGVTRKKSEYRDPYFFFHLNMKPGETRTIAFRVYTGEELLVPLTVRQPDYIETSTNRSRMIVYGVFIGLMAAMFLYNLTIYLYTRNSLYLIYVLYVLSVALAQLAIQGVFQNHLNFVGHFFNPYALPVFSAMVGILSPVFAYKFLKMERTLPRLRYAIHLIVITYIFVLVVVATGNFQLTYKLLLLGGSLGALTLVVLPIIIIVRNRENRQAKFFLTAWSMFLIGVVVYSLRDYGVLPYNNITNYTMPFGAALETILLSLALADLINTLKKEKEETQTQMFIEMRKNRDLIKNQNIMLEKKVTERTQKLEEANQNLQTTLDDLKAAQTQLVDAEKMASLGQLTAGIAHEINNPINFVTSNIEPLRQDVKDIVDVLNKYKVATKDLNEQTFEQIREEEEQIDLGYSIAEIESLLNGIEEGARRTSEIVNSLRTFSRLDEDVLKRSDLNDGLQSTITILKSEFGEVSLATDFGEIPEVDCYLGKLNQVFMNLLDNAIDAVKARYGNSEKGEINVKTELVDNQVQITVADNGGGMSEEVKNRVFEPFFTTKDVGSGTGLGLSISYGIIERHNGTIQVESEEGKGTKFVISLPVNNKGEQS